MPETVLTLAGGNRLLTSGARPTHIQFGNQTLPATDWPTQTAVPGAFKTIEIIAAIEGLQIQVLGVDDDDAAAYADFASLGIWIGDPASPDSILLSLGTAEAGLSYGAKVANIDLSVTAYVTLSSEQLGNITWGNAVILNATDSRYGMGRRATEQEAVGATGNSPSNEGWITPLRLGQWWNALVIGTNKIGAISADRISGFFSIDRITNLQGILNTKANVLSPSLDGTPEAPTPPVGDASTRIATTAFVYGQGFERIFLVTTGNRFPAGVTGRYHLFLEAVTGSLTWRDTDGITVIISAVAGDLARYDGTNWIRQVKRAGDVFMEAE